MAIHSKGTITNMKVYDMLGRMLIEKLPDAGEATNFTVPISTIKPGTILILKATFENGVELSKKTIKY